MKIGVSGTDSVGKSTLIGELQRCFEGELDVTVLSIGDIARSSPYPLVRLQDIRSSLWILENVRLEEQLAEHTCDLLICDRTALDIWAFTRLSITAGLINTEEGEDFKRKVAGWLPSYAGLFVAVVDECIPVQLNNVPEADLSFRSEFESALLAGQQDFEGGEHFVVLPASLEARLETISRRIHLEQK